MNFSLAKPAKPAKPAEPNAIWPQLIVYGKHYGFEAFYFKRKLNSIQKEELKKHADEWYYVTFATGVLKIKIELRLQ